MDALLTVGDEYGLRPISPKSLGTVAYRHSDVGFEDEGGERLVSLHYTRLCSTASKASSVQTKVQCFDLAWSGSMRSQGSR